MIVISISSVTAGEDEGVKGASPIPGTHKSTNWPAWNAIGSSGRSPKVLIEGVSSTMWSIVAGIGMYGLRFIRRPL